MALVMERRRGEKIILDTKDGRVEILITSGHRVGLAINAPKSVAITRPDMKKGKP